MFKLAVIRDNDNTPCPFGLSVILGCRTAGDAIDEMQLIDQDADDNQSVIRHNISLLETNPEPKKCKFAAHLFKNKPYVVDCNFGEADAGISPEVSFNGSPYFSGIGEGIGMGGLYNGLTDPYYQGGATYRNMYYGVGSWASKRHFRSILRQGLLKTLQLTKN